jgi:hypothetical protein
MSLACRSIRHRQSLASTYKVHCKRIPPKDRSTNELLLPKEFVWIVRLEVDWCDPHLSKGKIRTHVRRKHPKILSMSWLHRHLIDPFRLGPQLSWPSLLFTFQQERFCESQSIRSIRDLSCLFTFQQERICESSSILSRIGSDIIRMWSWHE